MKQLLISLAILAITVPCLASTQPISESPGEGTYEELRYYPYSGIGAKFIKVGGGEPDHATILIEYPRILWEEAVYMAQNPPEPPTTPLWWTLIKFLTYALALIGIAALIFVPWSYKKIQAAVKAQDDTIKLPPWHYLLSPAKVKFFYAPPEPEERTENQETTSTE